MLAEQPGVGIRPHGFMEMNKYPFKPNSVDELSPGDFWPIDLETGLSGCAIVLQTDSSRSTRIFLAAILDYHSIQPPSSELIAACQYIDQGACQIEAIVSNGGLIIGNCQVTLNRIHPMIFRECQHYNRSFLLKGLTRLRPQTAEDSTYPILPFWVGSRVVNGIASRHFRLPRIQAFDTE